MKAFLSASALALAATAAPSGEALAGGRHHHRAPACDTGLVYRSHSGFGHSHSRVSVGVSFGFGGHRHRDSRWSVGGAYYFAYPPRTYSYSYCDVPRVQTYTRAGVVVAPSAPVYVTAPPPTVVVVDGNRSAAGSQPSAVAQTATTYAASPAEVQRGFALLSDGQFDRAQRLFGAYASISDEALPKVGYALAWALQGDVSTSAWGMRRAFFFDADRVMYAPVDSGLRVRLERLSQQLQDRVALSGGDRDTLFVLASVEFLLGDRTGALFNVDRAIALGDDSESAQKLRALVAGAAPPAPSMYGPGAAQPEARPQIQTQPQPQPQLRIDPTPASAPAPAPAAAPAPGPGGGAAPINAAVALAPGSNGRAQPSAQ